MEERACSANPPAFAYANCYYLSFSPIAFMYKNPAIPKAGKVAKMTSVMSQPVIKAKMNPDINVPIVIMRVDIF
jgi:hypothetical protein